MTVVRPRAASASSSEASPAEAIESPLASDSLAFSAETIRRDRIVLSARANALLAAGLFLRVHIMHTLETLHQTLLLGANRSLILDSGIYSLR
jgi:hypothetical protein